MASRTAVIAWGSGEDGQLGIGYYEEKEKEKEWVCKITALRSEKVSSVVAGSRNSLAICEDGKLFTWGWNQRATLGHPSETKTEDVPSQVQALASVKIVQFAVKNPNVEHQGKRTYPIESREDVEPGEDVDAGEGSRLIS